jgi:cell division protein FtsB
VKAGRAQLGWTLLVLVWLPMAALLVWGRGGVLDLLALRKEVRALEAQASTLEKQNASLRAQIQKLQTDPSAYEAVARERLFLKKPGERILYIPATGTVPPPPPPDSGPASAGTPEKVRSPQGDGSAPPP